LLRVEGGVVAEEEIDIARAYKFLKILGIEMLINDITLLPILTD
jgi:hypothetical protein